MQSSNTHNYFLREKLLVYQAAFSILVPSIVKKTAKSYVSFTRTEKYGLIALCTLVLLFAALRIVMPYFVHPEMPTEEEKRLKAAWEVYKRSLPATASSAILADSATEYADVSEVPRIVNINTAVSATLERLKGIGPVMAGKIMSYRRKGGHFTDIDQIQEIQHIPDATFNELRPQLSVTDTLTK